MHENHLRHMQLALSLARRALGQTWPNPAVGAVLVKDGQIISEGFTAKGGRPHAETQALEQAAGKAKGATLYVSLEPCSHHGQTPPCVDAIIKAGVATCVVGCRDHNPRVNGLGVAQLKNAGIEVIEGVCENEAHDINRGFFSVIEKKRPLVALKIATSSDGKIAYPTPDKKWITGERARAYGHLLRARFDAIATGIGTVLADDPLLTCRLPGLEDRSPLRVIFDSELRLPADCQLAKTAQEVPAWIMTACRKKPPAQGISAWLCDAQNNHIDLDQALKILAQEGITRLLVEGGQKLTTAFLQAGLADEIYWFRAPSAIGSGGLAALADGQSLPLAHWRQKRHISLPPDYLDVFECSPAS